MDKKILIAVDDSVSSGFGLEYVAYLFSNDPHAHCILLHCQSSGEEIIPEPEDSRNSLMPDTGSGKRHQKSLRILARARQRLESLGFPAEKISTTSQKSAQTSMAIQKYAENNLVDSIVLAKRGVGLIGEMLLGSISSELSASNRVIPLWIIDGDVKPRNFFIPVDGSPTSLMAVDHLAFIFAGRDDLRFYFFHARGFLSPPPVCKPENFYDRWGKTWCDKHLSGNGCMFTGPTELLTDAGIPKECIHTLPEPTAIEESTAILTHARKNQCNTIVIGRRPANEVKGILGGVSKRTALQAENCALWLIG